MKCMLTFRIISNCLPQGALKLEVIALETRLAESESRRLKEVESLVEQLVEEQQARAQDTVKFKAMLAAVCQEKVFCYVF